MSVPPAQFSHQVTRLQFPKDVHFGDDISIWIAKVGDVAHGNMYLRVDWPVASTVDDSAGTRMIDFVELRYENDLLERHYGESLELMNDLSVTTGKQPVLTTLLGKGITSNLAAYYIRMPFRLNLPLCALDKAPVFRVKFRPSQEFSTLNWTLPIKVNLFVDYVYVTKAERDYFKTAKIDYLTHTIQRLQFTAGANATKSMFLTEFTRPVKELYWVIQTDGSAAYDYTNAGDEQLVSLRLQFNGIDVILPEIGTPLFLRTIQGLESHTRVPDRRFYMYPFALDPEHPTQSTGSVNMSALTRQTHTLELTSCLSSRQIRVYAVTHNVVRIADGAATSLFDNVQEGGTTLTGPIVIAPQLPLAVTSLTASSPTVTTVNLAWTRATFATSYSIVSTPETTTQTTSSASYTFTGLLAGTSYTFTVTSVGSFGSGGSTTSSSVSTPLPAAVTDLIASGPTTYTVNLAWTGAAGATSYSIESIPGTTVQTTSDTSLVFYDLLAGTSYTFTVTSVCEAGTGGSRTSSSVSTSLPAAVTDLIAYDPTTSTVNLAWLATPGATSYSIVSSPTTTTQTTTDASYTFTGLSASTNYTFTVTSVCEAGSGGSTTSNYITTT